MAILLPVGADSGCELYTDPQHQGVVNNASASLLADYSGFARNLTLVSNQPTFKTNIVNSNAVTRWNGTQYSLKNATPFAVRCGWIVAKYDGATFAAEPNYPGLIGGLVSQDILTGNPGSTNFYNFLDDYFEFRSNDRIYSYTAAPGPMNQFQVIFFRFWQTRFVNGIQIGGQRNFTDRNWKGDVGLCAVYSRDFYESEIRYYSQLIADYYALTLADVYPYQADKSSTQTPEQRVNFYDPPEGDRISEVLDSSKRTFELKFSSRRRAERNKMIEVHNAHYASATPIIYRDYSIFPPQDFEGYFDSEYELSGAVNNYNYGFRFKER